MASCSFLWLATRSTSRKANECLNSLSKNLTYS